MRKKYILLVFLILLFIPLTSFAAEEKELTLGESILEMAQQFGLVQTTRKLFKDDGPGLSLLGEGFVRFMLAIMLFAAFYSGLGKIFGDKKNVNVAISLSLALLCAVGIRSPWIESTMVVFGWLPMLLIFGALLFYGIYLQHKFKDAGPLPGFIMVITALFLFVITALMKGLASGLRASGVEGLTMVSWIPSLMILIAWFYAIWGFGRAITGFRTREGNDVTDAAGAAWDWARGGWGNGDGERARQRDENRRRQAEERERRLQIQREAAQRLGQEIDQLQQNIQQTRENEIATLRHLADLVNQLRALEARIRQEEGQP